ADHELLEFTRRVSELRAAHPTFRRLRFFDGKPVPRTEGAPLPDIVWLDRDGTQMTADDWTTRASNCLAVFINGQSIGRRDANGDDVEDDDFLLFFNASDEDVVFTLPPRAVAVPWEVSIETSDAASRDPRAL